jgi:alpha-amylase
MTDHLYQGQSNDCYWHGLFGGIYLSHMRLATLEHLIAAEDAVDRAMGLTAVSIGMVDLDVDGRDELLVRAPGQVVTVKPDEGGGIASWDARAARHALTSVMRRRPEAYHDTLRAADTGELAQQEAGEGAVSIHDLIKVNEPGISKRLWYDTYERRSGLVRVLATDTTPEGFEQATFTELGDFVSGAFSVLPAGADQVRLERTGSIIQPDGRLMPVRVRKTLTFGADRRVPTLDLAIEATNHGEQSIDALLGVEWALNMLGGGGNPAAWYAVDGDHGRFDAPRVAQIAHHVGMANQHLGVEVESRPQPAAAAWWSSIETISVSESGFEANHQGGCLLWVWPLQLAPGGSMSVSVQMLVRSVIDRAEEEGL